jgi:predicted metal-binding membrane protein
MADATRLETILRRDRWIVIGALTVVTAAGWAYLLQGAGTGMRPIDMAVLYPQAPEQGSGISMGQSDWGPGYTLGLFGMWWLMMIAMMLPSAAPMILLYGAATRRHLSDSKDVQGSSNTPFPAIMAFSAGYICSWGAFSMAAVCMQWWLAQGSLLSPMMASNSRMLNSALLIAAGLWQLTPLKSVCLRHCRSPVSFIAAHWRVGTAGAWIMGLRHGTYCLGCCWPLMALLFVGGVMNLLWIAGLALLVLLEKLMPHGEVLGKVLGVALIALGAWLAIAAG